MLGVAHSMVRLLESSLFPLPSYFRSLILTRTIAAEFLDTTPKGASHQCVDVGLVQGKQLSVDGSMR